MDTLDTKKEETNTEVTPTLVEMAMEEPKPSTTEEVQTTMFEGMETQVVVEKKVSVWQKIAKVLKISVWFLFLLFVFLFIAQIIVADKYQAVVKVSDKKDKISINPTSKNLDFGDAAKNSGTIRYVTIKSNGADAYIKIIKFGDIADLLKINKDSFVISEGQSERIEVLLYVPDSAQLGSQYSGWVWIFKIPKIW